MDRFRSLLDPDEVRALAIRAGLVEAPEGYTPPVDVTITFRRTQGTVALVEEPPAPALGPMARVRFQKQAHADARTAAEAVSRASQTHERLTPVRATTAVDGTYVSGEERPRATRDASGSAPHRITETTSTPIPPTVHVERRTGQVTVDVPVIVGASIEQHDASVAVTPMPEVAPDPPSPSAPADPPSAPVVTESETKDLSTARGRATIVSPPNARSTGLTGIVSAVSEPWPPLLVPLLESASDPYIARLRVALRAHVPVDALTRPDELDAATTGRVRRAVVDVLGDAAMAW